MVSVRAATALLKLGARPSPATRPFSASSRTTLPVDRESHGSSNHPSTPTSTSPSVAPRDQLLFVDGSSPTASTSSSPPPPPPPPSTSTTEMVIASAETSHAAFPVPSVPFSTQRFIRSLEKGGIDRKTAEVLMDATRNMLLAQEGKAGEELLGRQDLENEAYLYTAALSELRTESGVKARNDGIALRSMTSALQRETDAVSQRMKEDMQQLRSDIQLDMNQRKEETAQEMKSFDMRIMDMNSRFTIILGDVRTEIEATKWISTRRVMTALVVVVVSILAWVTLSPDKKKKDEETPHVPTVEELGVSRAGSPADDIGGKESWWWTSASGGQKPLARVGEEERSET